MGGQFTTFWQIPDKKRLTIMWEGNLLPFDRFQTKNNYNYVRGQFITFWQIPDKKIYNHLGGQFTNFWQIPYQKIITIMWEGNLPPFDRFQKKTIRLSERANYNLMTDSRQKNNYNYVRGQFTTFFDRFQSITIITIMWEGNLLPFDRFKTKR